MINLWFGVMVILKRFLYLSFVSTYFSINSILGVQCHKVNKCFFLSTDNQYVIVLCKTSWVFKIDEITGLLKWSLGKKTHISGHLKYLCIKASQARWQAERADIYLKLVSLLTPLEKVGCLFIRVACDMFSMLTWHDVLGIQWSGMYGSEACIKKHALQLRAEARTLLNTGFVTPLLSCFITI